jgi:Siphovirus Gp157
MPAASEQTVTLFKIEDRFLALLNTADIVPEKMEEEYQLALEDAELQAIDKREDLVQFFLWMDEQQEATRKEIERLRNRVKTIENIETGLKKYVVSVIKMVPPDAKGKYRHLQAQSALMFLRALPASVEIVNEGEVPDEYKTINLTMPLDLWRRLCVEHEELRMHETMGIDVKYVQVQKTLIKQAFEVGQDVPGADLHLSGHDHTLVIK